LAVVAANVVEEAAAAPEAKGSAIEPTAAALYVLKLATGAKGRGRSFSRWVNS